MLAHNKCAYASPTFGPHVTVLYTSQTTLFYLFVSYLTIFQFKKNLIMFCSGGRYRYRANSLKLPHMRLTKYVQWYLAQHAANQTISTMLTLGTYEVTCYVLPGYITMNTVTWFIRVTEMTVKWPWENLKFKLNFPFSWFILSETNSLNFGSFPPLLSRSHPWRKSTPL